MKLKSKMGTKHKLEIGTKISQGIKIKIKIKVKMKGSN